MSNNEASSLMSVEEAKRMIETSLSSNALVLAGIVLVARVEEDAKVIEKLKSALQESTGKLDNRVTELEKINSEGKVKTKSDKEWSVVRMLCCDEYHAHNRDDCFYGEVIKTIDVENRGIIVSQHDDLKVAQAEAKFVGK